MKGKQRTTNVIKKEVRGKVKVTGLTLPLLVVYGLGAITGALVNENGRRIREEEEKETENERVF